MSWRKSADRKENANQFKPHVQRTRNATPPGEQIKPRHLYLPHSSQHLVMSSGSPSARLTTSEHPQMQYRSPKPPEISQDTVHRLDMPSVSHQHLVPSGNTIPRQNTRGILHLKNQNNGVKLSDFIPLSESRQRQNILPVRNEVQNSVSESSIATEEWPSLDLGTNRNHTSHVPVRQKKGGPKLRDEKAVHRLFKGDSEPNNAEIKQAGVSYVEKLKIPLKQKQPKLENGLASQPQKQRNWRDQRTSAKIGELKVKLKNGYKEEAGTEIELDENMDVVDRLKEDKINYEESMPGKSKQTSDIRPKPTSQGSKVVKKAPNVEKKQDGDGDGTAAASEAVRAKRRARRANISAKKKEEREAQKLVEMRAPKDSKVTVLSGKTLENYLKSVSTTRTLSKGFAAKLEEFPGLSTEVPNRWTRVQTFTLAEIISRPAKPVEREEDKSELHSVAGTGFSDPLPEQKEEKKAPKQRDPIEFNLFDIAMAKSVMKKRNKDQKRSALQSSKGKRTVDTSKIIANTLDANAPVLSRGKIRTKAKKPTLMKRAILKKRQEKQKLLSVSTGMVAASSRLLPLAEIADEEWDEQPDQLVGLEAGNIVLVQKIEEKNKRGKRPKKEKKLNPESSEPVNHNRKFREYCDQMLTDDIDNVSVELLHDLVRFQDRAHQKDPIKAKMRKRLVFGLREVTRQVERGRVKAVIIAPNLEKCDEPGGLDDAIKTLVNRVQEKNVFCIYALDRWRLSRATKKRGMTSCLGIFNFQGSDDNYKKLLDMVAEARAEYARRRPKDKVTQEEEEEKEKDTQMEKVITLPVEIKREPIGASETLLSLLKAEIRE